MAKFKYIGGTKIEDFTPQVVTVEWWKQHNDKWDKDGDLGEMVKNTEPLYVRVERINRLPYYLKIRMAILAKNCDRSPYFRTQDESNTLHLSALHLELQLSEIVAELDKEYPANYVNERPEIPHDVILQKILKSNFSYSEFTVEVAEMIINRYLDCLACDSLRKPGLEYSKLMRLESMPLLRVIDRNLIRSYIIANPADYLKDLTPPKE